MSQVHECLVIGGGLAGSMMALRLARAGRSVLLVERERAAHAKVCGEFLSPEAVAYLRQAGLDPLALGASVIDRLRFLVGAHSMETALPFTALSLSRSALDAALLKRAREAGAEVRLGVTISRLACSPHGWQAACSGGSSIDSRYVVLATGKHDLHGCVRRGGAQTDLVGFKMHWRLGPAQIQSLRGVMALFLFRGGYGGISLVEGGRANLCLVVERSVLCQCRGWSGTLDRILRTNLGVKQILGGAQPLWDHPFAISPIPYGYLAGSAPDGLWRVGDQAAVIPSFTGDGMSIALHSAALAAETYLAGASAESYTHSLRKQLRPGMRLATLLSRALVSGPGRIAAPVALALCPLLIRWIAQGTRIPRHALSSMPLRAMNCEL